MRCPHGDHVTVCEICDAANSSFDSGFKAGQVKSSGRIDQLTARNAELEGEVARSQADAEYMQWIADNAEIVTTGQGMRFVMALNVFGNNNWSLRDYLSMEINGTMHDIARNALKESGL